MVYTTPKFCGKTLRYYMSLIDRWDLYIPLKSGYDIILDIIDDKKHNVRMHSMYFGFFKTDPNDLTLRRVLETN